MDTLRVIDVAEPVIVVEEDTPLAQLWSMLEAGHTVALRRPEGWYLLTPEAAVGYPRTRGVLDLPLRPVVTLEADVPVHDALQRLDAAGERLALVVEGDQALGVVSLHRLLEVTAKRAEQAAQLGFFLEESLKRLKAIAWYLHLPRPSETLPAGTLPEGARLDVYGPVEEVLGYTREEMQADPRLWFARLHQEDRDALARKLQELLHEDHLTWEHRFCRRDGRWIWLQERIQVEREAGGRLTGLRGITLDVTREMEAREEERLLARVHRALAGRKPGQGLEEAFRVLGEFLPIDNAAVFLVSREGVRMESTWVRPGWEEATAAIAQEMSRRMAALAEERKPPLIGQAFRQAIEEQRPVYLPDLRQVPGPSREIVAAHGLRSAFILPLLHREDLHALLVLTSGQVDALSPSQRVLLERLAPTLAKAVEAWYYEVELKQLNAQLEERVRQRTFELQILYEVAQRIGYTLDYAELFRLLVDSLHRVADYDVAATLLFLEDRKELLLYPARPLHETVETKVRRRVLATFKHLTGQRPDPRQIRVRVEEPVTSEGPPVQRLGSLFQVPLTVGPDQETVGLLLVAAERENTFDETQVRVLYTLAHHAGVSVHRLRTLLATEQRRLETLVEHLPAGVILLDAEGVVRLMNPLAREYLALLGLARVGETLTRLGNVPLARVLRVATERTPLEIQVADGPQRTFEVRVRPVEAGPEAGGHVLVIQDVTWERELLALERQRRRELEALYRLSRALIASHDLTAVLETVVRQGVEAVGVTFCRAVLLEGEQFVCRAAYSVRSLRRGLGTGKPDAVPAHPFYRQALSRGRPLVLQRGDLEAEEARQALRLDLAQSLCLAPLRVGDEPLGVLVFGEARSPDRESFNADKLRLIESIADQAASALHRAHLHEQLEQAYQEVQARAQSMARLVELGAELNRPLSIAEVIAVIGQGAQAVSGTSRVAVYVREDDRFVCRWAHGISQSYTEQVVAHLHEIPSRAFLKETSPILIPDVRQWRASSWLRRAAREEGYHGLALWPLVYQGRTEAVVACYYDAPHEWSAQEQEVMQAFAAQAAVALQNAKLYEDLEEAFVQTVLALSKAMDARDTYTADHSERMAAWAEAVARELGLSDEEVQAVRWGALLHDIGKIGVPDEILRKPGKLTPEEWEVIKKHPVIGAEIVAPVKRLANVAPIIRAHQEHYDGSGYPDGLKGEEIPIGARILAVVDAYSAITDERPYKKARSHEEAVAELRRCAGTQFDPQVVEAFLRVLERERNRPAAEGETTDT